MISGVNAEQAKDLFPNCKLKASVDKERVRRMGMDDFSKYWEATGGTLTVTLPEGETCQGISLSFKKETSPLVAEVMDEDGTWRTIGTYDEAHLHGYMPLEGLNGQNSFRIRVVDKKKTTKIARMNIWSAGELPRDEVQHWQDMDGEADLMLIVTHPDDDLIWFGGLLPTYAGEQGKKVIVVYIVGEPSDQRKNELLDGLWICGVKDYPVIGPFRDLGTKNEAAVVRAWGGEDAVPTFLTRLIRQYRPKVVVAQDESGEYGHKQHVAGVKAVVRSVTELAGDQTFDEASAQDFGVWTPKKLYLHMYRENELKMDWTQPLQAFGGETGESVSARAFKRHISQRKTHYHIYMSGRYDSQRLGLFFSTVGLDEAKNDLFEHIE